MKYIGLWGVMMLLMGSLSLAHAQAPPTPIDSILADLGQRVGATVTLNDLDRWGWNDLAFNDNTLGCPGEGRQATSGFTRGYVYTLVYRGVTFDYRAPKGGTTFFLCNSPDLNLMRPLPTAIPSATPIPTATFLPTATSAEAIIQPTTNAQTTTSPDNTPVTAATPDATSGTFYCPSPETFTGGIPSRLAVGMTGRYIGVNDLSLRAEATRTSAASGTLSVGGNFTVVGGPECDSLFTWWQLDSGGVVGWLWEVDSSSLGYLLEPTGSADNQAMAPVIETPPVIVSGAVPANRAVIGVDNAASVTELAQAKITGATRILTANPAFGPDNTLIVAALDGVRRYDNADPSQTPELTPPNAVINMVLSSDGNSVYHISASGPQGQVGFGAFSAGDGPASGESLDATYTEGMAFLPTLDLLAFGSVDSVLLFDPQTQAAVADLPLGENPNGLAASPVEDILAIALPSGQIAFWDASTRTEIGNVDNVHSELAADVLAFSSDGSLLAAGAGTSVNVWDVAEQTLVYNAPVFQAGAGEVYHVAFSPDGSLLAIMGGNPATGQGAGGLWNVETGAPIVILAGVAGFVSDLAFSPDGTLLNTLTREGVWQVWGVGE